MNLALDHARQYVEKAQRKYQNLMEDVIEPEEIGQVSEPKPQYLKGTWKIEVSNKTPYDYVAIFHGGKSSEWLEKPF